MGDDKQRHEFGWCKLENKYRMFVQTLNPKGYWVCGNCRFRTSKLLGRPTAENYL